MNKDADATNPIPMPPLAQHLADHTTPAGRDERALSARRRFLLTSGLGLLGGAALSQPSHASSHPGGVNVISSDAYLVGLVTNPDLPGLAGDLILNSYLAVASDGTGFGVLTDPLHPAANSHLVVLQSARHGNQRQYDGQITLSNTADWVGQPFTITAVIQNEFTALAFTIHGQTFNGNGLIKDGTSNTVLGDGSVRF